MDDLRRADAGRDRCAVDIEPETRNFSRAVSRYLTPEEKSLSGDPFWPGIVWCAKEALYKYSGRRELDFRRDLRVEQVDLAAGMLTAISSYISFKKPPMR